MNGIGGTSAGETTGRAHDGASNEETPGESLDQLDLARHLDSRLSPAVLPSPPLVAAGLFSLLVLSSLVATPRSCICCHDLLIPCSVLLMFFFCGDASI